MFKTIAFWTNILFWKMILPGLSISVDQGSSKGIIDCRLYFPVFIMFRNILTHSGAICFRQCIAFCGQSNEVRYGSSGYYSIPVWKEFL